MRTTITLFLSLLIASFLPITSGAQVQPEDLPKAGINVFWTNFEYFSGSAALTDAMKNSSGWFSEATLEMDEHGYPVSVPVDQQAQTFLYLETTHYPTGNYTLMWEGSGIFTVSTCGETYDFDTSSSKTQTVTVSQACEAGISLTIFETTDGDHLRNIRFYLPGHDETSGFWTDHYIDFHRQFGVTRFVWGSGLYSPQSSWDERSQLADRNWRDSDINPMEDNGVPFEAMIELANEANVDLWITSPVRADDHFEEQLATMLRDNLNDDLKVWIEWGNEYWNCGAWGYEGCVYLDEQDAANSDPEIDNPHFYAWESLDLFANFDSVFSATGERDRLYTVLGGQLGNSWQLQESTSEISRLGRLDDVDLFTIAPYYSGADRINAAYNEGGLDDVFPVLDSVAYDLFHEIGEIGEEFERNMALARTYNKPMVAYEGGQHITTWVGVPAGLPAMISLDERIYDHYMNYFGYWEDEEMTATFVHFTDIAQYNDDEAFALLDNYNQPLEEAPKLRAFLDWQAGITTSGERNMPETPARIELDQNYPNPFNPVTNISYSLPQGADVSLKVFDMTGRLVSVLVDEVQPAGTYQQTFDASNLSSGVYFYRLTANGLDLTRKMTLVK